MNNIFKNACFGKAYKTRKGDKVIYLRMFICNGYCHLVSNGMLEYAVNDNGEVDSRLYEASDVVSEWEGESINEEKLDNLAYDCAKLADIKYVYFQDCYNSWIDGFKTGCKEIFKRL